MTEKRWKAVERAAAAELNRVLSGIGNFTPVERIPLLGREGPDLTVNESGLVINVKSRQSIPIYLLPPAEIQIFYGDFVICRLNELLTRPCSHVTQAQSWKQLTEWYDLMDKWTKEFKPEGVSAIFLHRPRMPIGNMGVVIHFDNLRRLSCNLGKTNPSF